MSLYLISFEKGAMDHIPAEDMEQTGIDAHTVVREAKAAGVYVFAGGLSYDDGDVEAAFVDTDGVITDGPYPETKELIGGAVIVDVPTREDALYWAGKVAKACRCAQDVRKFMDDPER
jgi:hypothetical protein